MMTFLHTMTRIMSMRLFCCCGLVVISKQANRVELYVLEVRVLCSSQDYLASHSA